MKKKLLAMTLVVVMALTAVIGGTLAYFTDTDSDTNVMMVGNVKIYQNEQQRVIDTEVDNDKQHQNIRVPEDGLEDFENNKALFPYIGNVAFDTNLPDADQTKALDTAKNAIDKIVTVTNEGTEEAYIRTLFAFEMEEIVVTPDDPETNENEEVIKLECPAASKYNRLGLVFKGAQMSLKGDTDTNSEVIIDVNGVKYRVGEFYYPANGSKLAAGATSKPSLTQFYLNSKVGNEWYDHVGREYNILVVSQAVQTQGFANAQDALNTAFGDINELWKTTDGQKEVASWFGGEPAPRG